MERLFALSSILVLPFWLLMILAPRWRWTERLLASPFIVLGPLALYAALVGPDLLALLPALARPELPAIATLLGQPRGATIAWVHFVALDLFAARWMFLDARAQGLSAWVLSPLLLLTMMFAPLGLGAYLGLRAIGVANVRDFLVRVWIGNRPLALLTVGSGLLLAAALGLQLVDGRQLMGAPVWMKPAKFAAAVGLTTPVLAWIVGQLQGQARRTRIAAGLIAGLTAIELIIIVVQAARGVPSHFNNSTPASAALFAVMGVGITIVWLAEVYLAVRAFRQTFASPVRTWGIRLGLVGALFGGAVGFIMPRPTPAQVESLRAGRPTPLLGAHAVGVPDGGPGLSVTRWSTEGGDLRAPHFIGLHALQLLPLAAWMIERRRRQPRARAIIALGVGWIGLVAVTLVQALRGQPLLAPDAATITSLALVLAAALAIGARLPWPRTTTATELRRASGGRTAPLAR